MNPRRIIIVGPSSSGKTTIANKLGEHLGIEVLHMDDYRTRIQRPFPTCIHNGVTMRNYESPTCWDSNAITQIVALRVRANIPFVIEGNHLLTYAPIAALQSERYYIDLDFATCLVRRFARNRGTDADRTFALIGEEQNRIHVYPQKQMRNVVEIDGRLNLDDIVAMIANHAQVLI